jgi:dynein heavy chain
MPYSFDVVDEYATIAYNLERKYIYITPKSFLELIKLFSGMLGKKKSELENRKEKFENGLAKLENTEE